MALKTFDTGMDVYVLFALVVESGGKNWCIMIRFINDDI